MPYTMLQWSGGIWWDKGEISLHFEVVLCGTTFFATVVQLQPYPIARVMGGKNCTAPREGDQGTRRTHTPSTYMP